MANDADPASTGTASRPLPINPIANSAYAALPSGRSASAACLVVSMSWRPARNSVEAVARMMKNCTTLENVMPAMTSSRASASSASVAPRRRPIAFSASTSCDACQKNKYGEIVVPRIATVVVMYADDHSICGTTVRKSPVRQFGCARIADTM